MLFQGVEDIMAPPSNATQYFILFVGKISLRQNDFDILEDDFETLDPGKVNGKYPVSNHGADSLIRDCLELVWSINKPRPDLICKLENCDKVAYAEAKTHRDLNTAPSLPNEKAR
jgi:hypothetical protein